MSHAQSPPIAFASPTVLKNGDQKWRVAGLLHRLDGPAVIDANGNQEWFFEGTHHRLDGPAIIRTDGIRIWIFHGKYHRLDGPAVIGTDGSEEWYIDDKLHRLDGPAVLGMDGSQEWWIHGHNITYLSAHQKLAYIRAYQQSINDASLSVVSQSSQENTVSKKAVYVSKNVPAYARCFCASISNFVRKWR